MITKKSSYHIINYILFLSMCIHFINCCIVIGSEHLEQTLCKSKICPYYGKCVIDENGFFPKCVCPIECDLSEFNIDYNSHHKRQNELVQTELIISKDLKICGNDGIDYKSICDLKKQSCNLQKDIRIHYLGSCGNSIFSYYIYLFIYVRFLI
jgi:hypothetical protein